MKTWKLLPPERRKQLLIILMFRLSIACIIVLFGIAFIVEVGIKNYMMIGLYTLLILIFVQSNKETIVNFKELVNDLEDDLSDKLEYESEFNKED